nr:hypothetical protein [Tanacetum cinerariifolium]
NCHVVVIVQFKRRETIMQTSVRGCLDVHSEISYVGQMSSSLSSGDYPNLSSGMLSRRLSSYRF